MNRTVVAIALNLTLLSSVNANVLTKQQLMDINANNALYVQELEDKKEWYQALAERAQRWGYNHSFATVLKEHRKQIKSKEQLYDSSLSFEKISSLVQSGTARGMYLVGGIVDEVDASTQTVDDKTIALHDKAYRLVKYPYLSPSRPNWRDYLFKKQKLDLSDIPKELLPKTDTERKIWKENVEIGWERGTKAGYREIQSRWLSLYADLIGMTRYWTAVELNIIDEAHVKIAKAPIEHEVFGDKDNLKEELRVNPTVIQIDAQSTFNPNITSWDAVSTMSNTNGRGDVRDAVIRGDLYIEDVTNSQLIIETPDFQETQRAIPNESQYRR